MRHHDPEIEHLLADLAKTRGPAIQLGLGRVEDLLAHLGKPQECLPPVVHVAGTNGKGSLLAYLKAMLEAAGYRVHRYTSPHLVRFNERIQLAGKAIEDDYLLHLLQGIYNPAKDKGVTFFEATTALAFQAFAEVKADILLLETGLGGRLDATNVLAHPLLTAITPVSMDHMDFLGNALSSIATEKAGILKKAVRCVLGPQEPEAEQVIAARAAELGAPLYAHGNEWRVRREGQKLLYGDVSGERYFQLPALAGEYQIYNAGTAIACAKLLETFALSDTHIDEGLAQVQWPGRLQQLPQGSLTALLPEGSELWLDGGHNESAGRELGRWIGVQQKPVHIICGMLGTKDSEAFLKSAASAAASLSMVAIEGEPLSRSAEELASIASQCGLKNEIIINIKNAIQNIVNKNKNEFYILICGSLSLAGNTLWQNSTEAE